MRSSRIVFLSCLLSTAFYFCSPTLITTSSSFIELPAGRPSVRKLSMLSPYDKHKYHKVKVSSKVPLNVKVFSEDLPKDCIPACYTPINIDLVIF